MKALIIALALSVPTVLAAQSAPDPDETAPDLSHPWNLSECVDWAMEHNLTVARQGAAVESAEIDKSTAVWSIAPSVSGSVSQNFNFGRGIGGDNTYESGNSSSTGFSLGAGMTLFDGLATPNRIKLAKLNLDAATEDLEKTKDDIRIGVAKAYVQILYNYEIEDVAREQLAIDSLQVERLEGLFGAGAASAADVSQQKASLAQSRVTLVQASNSVRESLLDLAQLLELPSWEGFSIVRPEVSMEDVFIGSPDDIYEDAVGLRPAVKAEQIRLEGMDRSIAIARSAYYPSLSVNAGLGTNYYSNFGTQGFWDQLNSNFSQYVGLSLNVPIFNRMATRNQVRSAKLNRQNQELQLRQVKQSLYKEIQQAWNGTVAARAKYEASLEASAAAEDAFELTKAKYENGKATITEFNEARNRVVKARSDSVQATYEYLFQTRLVQYYRGGALTL